jgi:basic membrane lipoprotein Med (substrate-binding protein (PBP1-ABC) superfamily)
LSWGSASFAEQKKLKVAAMLGSPVEQQWVGRLHDALVMAQERGDIDYVVSENVEDADMIRVLREYAEGGYDLIVGEVYPVEREARRVTQDYPNVAFLLGSSLHPQAPNFAVFDNWNQDAAYLAGLIAGGMTKSNVIGAVGGYPIPEVNRLVGAYKQGACEANPNVKVLVTYVGSWYDPPKSKESGIAQVDSGADFIYAERFGAIHAAQERGIPAVSNLTHYQREYRDTVVTSTLWHAEPFIDAAIEHVRSGSFEAVDYGQIYGLMRDGGASLAEFGPWEEKIPADVLAKVREREEEVRAGTFQAEIVSDIVKSGGC